MNENIYIFFEDMSNYSNDNRRDLKEEICYCSLEYYTYLRKLINFIEKDEFIKNNLLSSYLDLNYNFYIESLNKSKILYITNDIHKYLANNRLFYLDDMAKNIEKLLLLKSK